MARPLRIVVTGGWYHVTARGNRREKLFHQDPDRRGFLGMVAELPERFGLEVHAFVLMDNHYHLCNAPNYFAEWEPKLQEPIHRGSIFDLFRGGRF